MIEHMTDLPSFDFLRRILHFGNGLSTGNEMKFSNRNNSIKFLYSIEIKFERTYYLYAMAMLVNVSRLFLYTGSLKPCQ
jgi:hypothetical protein